jgi:hypothetical protein
LFRTDHWKIFSPQSHLDANARSSGFQLNARGQQIEVAFFGLCACALALLTVILAIDGYARFVISAMLISWCVIASTTQQAPIIVGMMLFLPCLGEVRRLLLYIAPWSGTDPIQMIGPGIAAILFAQAVRRNQSLPQTRIGSAVRILFAVMVLQIFNPLQGSIVVGLAGAMFYIVPLMWFWIGRNFASTVLITTVLQKIVPTVAILAAVMGLWQALVGFLPHQQYWIDNHGYAALFVSATQIRSFSIFNSGQEYAAYMVTASAIVSATVMITRNPLMMGAFPLYMAGAFVQASRGPMLGFLQVLSLGWAVSNRKPVTWLPRLLGAMCLMAAIGYFFLKNLDVSGTGEGFQAIAGHQIDGLTDPLNSEKSTATTHLAMKGNGIVRGIIAPWGQGLGSTTLAASKFGSVGGSTEVDISNMFVSLGIVGGIVYILVITRVIKLWVALFQHRPTVEVLAIGLILAGNFGQWLSGGLYALAPLFWLSIGYLDRVSIEEKL